MSHAGVPAGHDQALDSIWDWEPPASADGGSQSGAWHILRQLAITANRCVWGRGQFRGAAAGDGSRAPASLAAAAAALGPLHSLALPACSLAHPWPHNPPAG